MRTRIVALICVLFCITAQAVIADGLVPITTSSSEARAAYLRARDLFENLRNIEARADLQAALAADPDFALAWIALAQASTSAQEFFENVERAAELTDKVSPGERLWIEGFEAGVKGLTDVQLERYTELASTHGDDPRVYNLLGTHYFGQQNWPAAIAAFEQATHLVPSYSPPIQHARLLASFRR